MTIDDTDRRIIERMCMDIGEGAHPFREIASELGIAEDELLARLKAHKQYGAMRRFGAVLRHQRAGFTANGMSVWNAPDGDVDRVGRCLAECERVSHCYERPRLQGWPYNIYAMIHAGDESACLAVARHISETTHIEDYQVLFSRREFKKTSAQLSFSDIA